MINHQVYSKLLKLPQSLLDDGNFSILEKKRLDDFSFILLSSIAMPTRKPNTENWNGEHFYPNTKRSPKTKINLWIYSLNMFQILLGTL